MTLITINMACTDGNTPLQEEETYDQPEVVTRNQKIIKEGKERRDKEKSNKDDRTQ